jgi:hypothetical protein
LASGTSCSVTPVSCCEARPDVLISQHSH